MKLTSLEDPPWADQVTGATQTTQSASPTAPAPSVPSPTMPTMPGKKPCGCGGKKPVNENIININAGNTTTDTNMAPTRFLGMNGKPTATQPASSTTAAANPAPIVVNAPATATPAPAPQVITKTVEIPSRSVTYLKNNTTANYREFY